MSTADNVRLCMENLQIRIDTSLRGKVKPDKFALNFQDENIRQTLDEFIREPEVPLLFVQSFGDKISCSLALPTAVKRKAIYFLKSNKIDDMLKIDDMKDNLVSGELTVAHLDTLHLIAQEIYFPLLSNPANRGGWSGPTAKDVMLKFSRFLSQLTMTVGQSKGQTLLPHPPPEAFDEDNLPEKERIHLLETSVVQWTEKIQSVLATDPEQAMKQGQHPDPLMEMEFWRAKASDLTSLHEQLQNPRMKDVLSTLEDMKSQLAARFELMAQDVVILRNEAIENTKYLNTMKEYFETLRDEMDFLRLDQVFYPMLHNMLLVWKHSTSYNTKPRLIVWCRRFAML